MINRRLRALSLICLFSSCIIVLSACSGSAVRTDTTRMGSLSSSELDLYYVAIGSREFGPVTRDVVTQWYREGRVLADHVVRSKGTRNWQSVRSFLTVPGPIARPTTTMTTTSDQAMITTPEPARPAERKPVEKPRPAATPVPAYSPADYADGEIFYVQIEGMEFGPVDLETLKRWMSENRISRSTPLRVKNSKTYNMMVRDIVD